MQERTEHPQLQVDAPGSAGPNDSGDWGIVGPCTGWLFVDRSTARAELRKATTTLQRRHDGARNGAPYYLEHLTDPQHTIR